MSSFEKLNPKSIIHDIGESPRTAYRTIIAASSPLIPAGAAFAVLAHPDWQDRVMGGYLSVAGLGIIALCTAGLRQLRQTQPETVPQVPTVTIPESTLPSIMGHR